MRTLHSSEALILLLGDIVVLAAGLWGALALRFGTIPSPELLRTHVGPFALLFIIWIGVFFAAGLYEKQTSVLRSRLPSTLFNAQLINIALAIAFFYLVPALGITPKTILFFYLTLSFPLILYWRIVFTSLVRFGSREEAVLVGSGKEMEELREEFGKNPRYPVSFTHVFDMATLDAATLAKRFEELSGSTMPSVVVADFDDPRLIPLLSLFSRLLFRGVRCVDFHELYESVFDRVPLPLLDHRWGIEQSGSVSRTAYDSGKRVIDIVLGAIGSLLSVPLCILATILILLDDGHPVLIRQERIGKDGKKIYLYKFRTMRGSDRGKWVEEGDHRITRAGAFLRATRIDELPQLWSVLKGDMSLIGPRPDVIGLGEQLMRDIPYYLTRYLIKPGLSGWAQVRQDLPPQSLEETKLRLSYDLYYLKHRSFWLDIKIVFQTVKTLLSRSGK